MPATAFASGGSSAPSGTTEQQQTTHASGGEAAQPPKKHKKHKKRSHRASHHVKGLSIVGVNWGEFVRREPERFAAVMTQLGAWFQAGKLRPYVSDTLPLERAAEALTRMASREVKGKLVLIP